MRQLHAKDFGSNKVRLNKFEVDVMMRLNVWIGHRKRISLMKFKALFWLSCLLCSMSTFADQNHHVYPEIESSISKPHQDGLKWPGYCEIEVINDSYTSVRVYGVFDDGVMLRPFTIYTYEYPHYISLYYYGYCHYGMDLYVDTLSGYRLYAGYTTANTTIHIVPYMMKEKPKVEVMQKQNKA